MELLKKLAETPGVPGHEDAIRALTKSELSKVCDSVKTDALGNVIGFRSGKVPRGKRATARKVMVVAHMDEIGFMVGHVEEKTGFLRIHPIGGFDPKTLIAQRVMVHGKKKLCGVIGSKPIHIMTPEELAEASQARGPARGPGASCARRSPATSASVTWSRWSRAFSISAIA